MAKTLTINAPVFTADRIEPISSGAIMEISSYSKNENSDTHNIFTKTYASAEAKAAGKIPVTSTQFTTHFTFEITDEALQEDDIYTIYLNLLKSKIAEKLETPSSNIVIE